MLNGRITLDYNDLMAPFIGSENGLEPESVKALEEPLQRVHQEIQSRQGQGSDFLGFLDLPQEISSEIPAIEACAKRLAELSDQHVVLGIGGSYLGARALISALCHPYYNELSREQRQGHPRIYFEGNNMDSDAFSALLDLLPQSAGENPESSWTMNVISKSGGTLETAVAFRVLRQLAESHYGENASKHIVATTDVSKGKLKNLADKKGYESFVIPDNVGGRYSVFTAVGLLPAAVAGVSISDLIQGAQDMAELCKKPGLENPAYLYAGLQYLSSQAGRQISVMNIWDKSLEFMGFWYDQLAAESLGKEGQGRVPLTGVCTRDLHARGQQLQEGARNTVITNLYLQQPQHYLSIASDDDDGDELNYLAGKPMHELLQNAFEGTNYAYARDGRPSMSFILADRSAYTLGALMYLFEVATLAEGYLMEINPLNQPGVEAYKNFMFGLLGREDKKEYREEFEQRPAKLDDYKV